MWQAIGTLLISAAGGLPNEIITVAAPSGDAGVPAVHEAHLNSAVVASALDVDESPVTADSWQDSPLVVGDGGTPATASNGLELGQWFAGPRIFNSYWDPVGGRSPTDWVWGYGPECQVATARLEWLLWFSRGRNSPILAHTINAKGAILDYPVEPIGQDMRNGGRITVGHILADQVTWAEGRFWGLEDGSEKFVVQSNTLPILAQPVFNVSTGRAGNVLIAAPGFATGSISVLSKNDLIGADAWLRRPWWDDGYHRFSLLAGYQFTRLDDSLVINRSSTSLAPINPSTVVLQDSFRTQNEFHGASIGFASNLRRNCVSLEVLSKVGLGDMHETVIINGSTTVSQSGSPTQTSAHGIFAQSSNAGIYNRHRFAAVPEVNLNGIVHLSPQWQLLAGYSIIYWSNAALAGNQIDTRVNFSQFPGPVVGPLRPTFTFNRSDFLVQGLSLGAEYCW